MSYSPSIWTSTACEYSCAYWSQCERGWSGNCLLMLTKQVLGVGSIQHFMCIQNTKMGVRYWWGIKFSGHGARGTQPGIGIWPTYWLPPPSPVRGLGVHSMQVVHFHAWFQILMPGSSVRRVYRARREVVQVEYSLSKVLGNKSVSVSWEFFRCWNFHLVFMDLASWMQQQKHLEIWRLKIQNFLVSFWCSKSFGFCSTLYFELETFSLSMKYFVLPLKLAEEEVWDVFPFWLPAGLFHLWQRRWSLSHLWSICGPWCYCSDAVSRLGLSGRTVG